MWTLMPPKHQPLVIPKYHGGADDVPVEKWLRLFDFKANTNNWTEQDKINNFSEYIEGEAFRWYITEIFDSVKTWEEVMKLLTVRFATPVADPFRSFIHCRQKKGQPVVSYFEEKRRLGESAELKATHVVSGLTDGLLPELELALAGLPIQSPTEWLASAQRIEIAMSRQSLTNAPGYHQRRRLAHSNNVPPNQQGDIPSTECRHCSSIGLPQQYHWHSTCPHRPSTSALTDEQGNGQGDPRLH